MSMRGEGLGLKEGFNPLNAFAPVRNPHPVIMITAARSFKTTDVELR